MSCHAKEILKETVHAWYETLLFFFTNKNEVGYDTRGNFFPRLHKNGLIETNI